MDEQAHTPLSLADIENWTVEHGDLNKLLPAFPKTPVVFCHTRRDFIEPQVAALNLSETIRSMYLQSREQTFINQEEEGDVTRGVFIPGMGCYVNGPGLASLLELDEIDGLFNHPRGLAEIITTIIHEKYGHGFISECTTAGREKRDNNLYCLRLAAGFGESGPDSPVSSLVQEKINIVFASSRFLEEGWAVWLENHVLGRVRGKICSLLPSKVSGDISFLSCNGEDKKCINHDGSSAGNGLPETSVVENENSVQETHHLLSDLRKTGATISRYGNSQVLREKGSRLVKCADYLATLAYPDSIPDPGKALDMASRLQQMADDRVFTGEFEYEVQDSFPHYVGCLLFCLLDYKFGSGCLAAALLLACNVKLDIKKNSLEALRDLTQTVPGGNINARLIQILSLPLHDFPRNSSEDLKKLAWDVLSFPGEQENASY